MKNWVQDNVVYVGDVHKLEFGNDPLALQPFLIRVYSCLLPARGLYSIEFEYNEVVLASCFMLVEEIK